MPATTPRWHRPLIDLDLGRAHQYGYRTHTAEVTHHHAAPPIDLRAARHAARISQYQLAGLIGTSHESVRRWESGDRCPEVMRRRWYEVCGRRVARAAT